MMVICRDMDLYAVCHRKAEELDVRSTLGIIGDVNDLMTIHSSERIQCPGEGGRKILVKLRLQAATCISKATALRTAAIGIS